MRAAKEIEQTQLRVISARVRRLRGRRKARRPALSPGRVKRQQKLCARHEERRSICTNSPITGKGDTEVNIDSSSGKFGRRGKMQLINPKQREKREAFGSARKRP